MAKLSTIEGIGGTYAGKLEGVGVATTDDLLKKGASPAGRKQIAEETGISAKLILGWVNKADLMRIDGVGEEYSDLLEAAGVDTVPELAQRNPENLHAKLLETNEAKQLVRAVPGAAQVERWVAQAKKLDRVVKY